MRPRIQRTRIRSNPQKSANLTRKIRRRIFALLPIMSKKWDPRLASVGGGEKIRIMGREKRKLRKFKESWWLTMR